jgi:hypothetical protein
MTMRTEITLLLAAALLLPAGGTLAEKANPQTAACGGTIETHRGTAAADTVFTVWYTDSKSDSGYDFVEVDRAGDTLNLYMQWVTGPNPHLRIWGPFGSTDRSNRKRLWRFHRLMLLDAHEIFESAADITTQGANTAIRDISEEQLFQTPDSAAWRQTWLWMKNTGARDTVGVVRTVLARRGMPYFLVRYQLTWLGAGTDSVRLFWASPPRMGTGGGRHDVGFAPGHGLVLRQKELQAAPLGWWAAMLDIGNPMAGNIDTTEISASSFMWSGLKLDFGSGQPEFAAAFVCFNPNRDIVPSEFAWMNSMVEGETSLDFDSASITIDSTRVLDSGDRTFIARTPVLVFSSGETKTLEYAVGRARLAGDGLPPVFPDVIWTDGTLSRCPTGTVGK